MKRIRNAVLAVIVATAAQSATAEWKQIGKGERDALIVAELSTHGDQSFAWLYRFLEANAVSSAASKLGGAYRAIYALSKSDATLERFANGLAGMAQNEQVRAIDVVLNLHGAPDWLAFHDGGYDLGAITRQIRSYKESASKLRMLYSTACYGESHADDFLAAGFLAVSGARAVNANAAHDYGATLGAWRSGYTLAEAQDRGNNSFWLGVWDNLASMQGFGDVDSFKTVHGVTDLSIHWMWQY